MIKESIKKLKNNLESKHKEMLRIRKKIVALGNEAEDSGAHSDKTRIQNSLYKLKSDMKHVESEIGKLKEEIYGSWAPPKHK